MCPLPRRQVMGVPADLDELAGTGLMSSDGMARARQDPGLPATLRNGDVPVAAFVAAAIYLADVRPKVKTFPKNGGSSSGPYGPW